MIVPGSANALLLAQAGEPLDEFGKIERSVRFRSVAGGHLSRTPAAASNMKKGTFNAWVKKSGVGVSQALLSAGTTASTYFIFYWDTSDRLTIYGGNQIIAVSNPIYRDPAAHLNVNMVFDADNATALDRFIVEVDGARITSWQTYAPWTQGAPSPLNSAVPHNIGRDCVDGLDLLSGCLSNVAWVDGQALPSTAFVRFHPKTGQWRPKSKSAIRAAVAAGGGARNGWGANGFFLPFDDVSSLIALGYDRSQSDSDTTGNNWTANNISLAVGATYDSLLDTPTNNFCTWNPIDNLYSGNVLSNGNLRVTTSVGSPFAPVKGTIGMSAGKWYWECVDNSPAGAIYTQFGIIKTVDRNDYLGVQTTGYCYWSTGSKSNNDVSAAYGTAFTQGDVIGVALDMDSGTLTFYKNGVSQGIAYSGLTGTFFAAACDSIYNVGGQLLDANFGQRPFAYTPPAGFKALCTKNLPFPRIPNPKAAYAAVTDSGANIVAALTAASPWPSWIRIYKRRDAAEGWRWQFSDDPANCLDSSQAVGRFAFPALSGVSYSGQAFNVAASNGIAMGRLSHTSGVADVVADGLSNARKMVILKSETLGTWYVYHPELAAGKLLYLNSMAAETTDATISTVTAGGFTVAAALATDVYRWMAFAETTGFLKLGAYTGNNASPDGPFGNLGGSPLFFLQKNAGNAETSWRLFDSVRSPRNPAQALLFPTFNYAEESLTANATDLVSNGFKLRTTDTALNQAVKNVFMAVLAPFRYANAR